MADAGDEANGIETSEIPNRRAMGETPVTNTPPTAARPGPPTHPPTSTSRGSCRADRATSARAGTADRFASTAQTDPTAKAGGLGSMMFWVMNSQGWSAQPTARDRGDDVVDPEGRARCPSPRSPRRRPQPPAAWADADWGLRPTELNATTIHDSGSATDRVTWAIAVPGVLAIEIRPR